jgi:hypothetical protein
MYTVINQCCCCFATCSSKVVTLTQVVPLVCTVHCLVFSFTCLGYMQRRCASRSLSLSPMPIFHLFYSREHLFLFVEFSRWIPRSSLLPGNISLQLSGLPHLSFFHTTCLTLTMFRPSRWQLPLVCQTDTGIFSLCFGYFFRGGQHRRAKPWLRSRC